MVNIQQLIEKGNKVVGSGLEFGDTKPDAHVLCPAGKLVEFAKWLKSTAGGDYVTLMCVSGVDMKEWLESVYHFYSYATKHMLTVKVKITDVKNPHVPTLCDVYKSANWWERETYDLMGITFDGHPDLRRILCPAEWEGHPLRKDYKAQEFYMGIPMTPGAPTVKS